MQAAPYHGEAIHEAQHALRVYFQRSQCHSGNVLIASEMDVYFDTSDGPLRKLRPDLLVAFGVAREPEATSYRVLFRTFVRRIWLTLGRGEATAGKK